MLVLEYGRTPNNRLHGVDGRIYRTVGPSEVTLRSFQNAKFDMMLSWFADYLKQYDKETGFFARNEHGGVPREIDAAILSGLRHNTESTVKELSEPKEVVIDMRRKVNVVHNS